MNNHLVLRTFAAALLSLIALTSPLQAQNAVTTSTAGPFAYDISQETTISGTVSSLVQKPFAGMIMGGHLMMTTSSGPLDASLGTYGLRGAGATAVVAGQQIEVTGVMKTINNKQVFLVRVLKTGGQIYTIRNEHGFPVSPEARERASRKSAGESL